MIAAAIYVVLQIGTVRYMAHIWWPLAIPAVLFPSPSARVAIEMVRGDHYTTLVLWTVVAFHTAITAWLVMPYHYLPAPLRRELG
jgi:hypothetical protein